MVRRLGMLKAHDRKSKASHKFRLEVSGNGSLWKCSYCCNSRSKDEAPEEIKTFLKKIQVLLHDLVINVRSDNAFEQRSLKPGLQGFTSGQISLGLDLTYAPSTITSQKPTERELDLLFEAMYDDYIGGQLSVAPRTTSATPAP
ncbi:hypothetical protein Tco_0617284 [Tanacetum coccineum]